MQERDIDRRTFVSGGVATGALALAGCFGTGGDDEPDENATDGNETDDNDTDENETDDSAPDVGPTLPVIEDKPDAVYVPSHRESMRHLEPIADGDYRLAPMLSYPHPFWLVAGGDGTDAVERVDPETMLGVHLMFTLWDAETGVILPVDSGAEVTLSRDGELVDRQSLWSMISQEMGFHFGDNVPLAGEDDDSADVDGTYAVEIELPPLSARTTGDLEGRFTDRKRVTFEFDYDQAFRDDVYEVTYMDEERRGEPGALEPMEHGDVPYSRLPEVDEVPGTLLVEAERDGDDGESEDGNETETDDHEGRPETTADLPRSGDAAILATALESDHRLADGDRPYLLVSPRTPYNRVPLPSMRLSATVERDGETVTEGSPELAETIDGEYGIHYGRSLETDALRSGDRVTLTVQSPPQVARHQGYDTAFLEMEPIELRVPEGI